MPTEIICAIIAVAGTVVSSLIAWFVSRSTANKEIEKMQLSWAREDIVSSDDEFASMSAAVARYIQCNNGTHQREAMAAVASIRAKESGEIGSVLDELYRTISSGQSTAADRALTCVIENKRNAKSQAKE